MKFNIIKIPRLASTNSYMQEQVEKKALQEGDVVRALFQDEGKGQGGNNWESEYGKNLLFSMMLEPKTIDASQQFILTQLVSLALLEEIIEFLVSFNIDVKIKWPNDIYVDNKKIAGMLFQNSIKGNKIDYSIVGIGVNINQLKFLSSAPNPISIIHFTKKLTDIDIFLNKLLSKIGKEYDKVTIHQNKELLKERYVNSLFRFNSWHNYSDSEGIFYGKIIDIDEYGRLIVLKNTGKQKVYMHKEIGFDFS